MSTALCEGGRSTPRTTPCCSRPARPLRRLQRSAPKEKRHERARIDEALQREHRYQILRHRLWPASRAQPFQEGGIGQSQRTPERREIDEGSSRGSSLFICNHHGRWGTQEDRTSTALVQEPSWQSCQRGCTI